MYSASYLCLKRIVFYPVLANACGGIRCSTSLFKLLLIYSSLIHATLRKRKYIIVLIFFGCVLYQSLYCKRSIRGLHCVNSRTKSRFKGCAPRKYVYCKGSIRGLHCSYYRVAVGLLVGQGWELKRPTLPRLRWRETRP